jgi:hypothetical protein
MVTLSVICNPVKCYIWVEQLSLWPASREQSRQHFQRASEGIKDFVCGAREKYSVEVAAKSFSAI